MEHLQHQSSVTRYDELKFELKNQENELLCVNRDLEFARQAGEPTSGIYMARQDVTNKIGILEREIKRFHPTTAKPVIVDMSDVQTIISTSSVRRKDSASLEIKGYPKPKESTSEKSTEKTNF